MTVENLIGSLKQCDSQAEVKVDGPPLDGLCWMHSLYIEDTIHDRGVTVVLSSSRYARAAKGVANGN